MLDVFENDSIHPCLRMSGNCGVSVIPPLPYKYAGTARIKLASAGLVTDLGPTSPKAASHVALANRRPATIKTDRDTGFNRVTSNILRK